MKGGRLEGYIRPLNYRINIRTNFKTFRFSGSEEIDIVVDRAAGEITLNARNLEIPSASVECNGVRRKARVSTDAKNETVTLRLRGSIKGNAILRISFSGRNDDSMYGFYRSRYTGKSGKRAFILSSQFESAGARQAFPCFDEPIFKATFELSIVTEKNMTAISNMPIASENVGRMKTVSFEKTPRMSTYILYMGVGRFDVVEGTFRGKKVRAFATPGKGRMCLTAMSYAIKFLRFYEGYFGIPYPMKKLDVVAVPDFAYGAMENWGAITFNERDILADESTSLRAKRNIAITVAHELAHHWFGDLVTMEWWDDLWLNESFATFMSYKAVDSAFPSWKVGTEFYSSETAVALSEDQLKNTHPIYANIRSVNEIDSLFDEISYQKGGAVLKMIEDYVGAERFRSGLHSYLKEHAFGNATKDDLWKALDSAGKRVGSIANCWITQKGYPALSVSGNGPFTISQERFLLHKGMRIPGSWSIPVHYVIGGREGFKVLESKRSQIAGGHAWIKANYGQNGVYRVFYDSGTLDRLCGAIRDGKLGDVDCWGVCNDLFVLVRSGRMKVEEYLKRMDVFSDCGYPANVTLMRALAWVHSTFINTGLESKTGEALSTHASRYLKQVGWKDKRNDRPHEKRVRSISIACLGIARDGKVVKRCMEMFLRRQRGVQIDANIRRAVYNTVAYNGSAKEYSAFISIYEKQAGLEEKVDILTSLAMFRDLGLVRKALDFSVSNQVRRQDSWIVVGSIGSNSGRHSTHDAGDNSEAERLYMTWMKNNWAMLMGRYHPGVSMLGRFAYVLSSMNRKEELDEFKRFFSNETNMRDDIRLEVAKTIERISVNIDCRKSNLS